MELQDLVLRVAISQLRFPASARFVDRRGALIEGLQGIQDLPHWAYGENLVDVFYEDRTMSLAAGSREARVVFEAIDDVETMADVARRTFSYLLRELAVREVTFIGVRTHWIAAVDDFAGLNDWLVTEFSGAGVDLLTLFDRPVKDSGWVFELTEADPKYHVRVGPMTQAQAFAQFFAHHDEDVDPDAFLFVDIDRILSDAPIAAADVPDQWDQSFRANLAVGRKVAQFFEEKTR